MKKVSKKQFTHSSLKYSKNTENKLKSRSIQYDHLGRPIGTRPFGC